jgi:hypothetical protein
MYRFWNSLILGWIVIAYPFRPTRHDHWMPEHSYEPATLLEAVQLCCRYIELVLILLTCCLCSNDNFDEVAKLYPKGKRITKFKVLAKQILLEEDPSHPLLQRKRCSVFAHIQPRTPRVSSLFGLPGEPVFFIIAAHSGLLTISNCSRRHNYYDSLVRAAERSQSFEWALREIIENIGHPQPPPRTAIVHVLSLFLRGRVFSGCILGLPYSSLILHFAVRINWQARPRPRAQ